MTWRPMWLTDREQCCSGQDSLCCSVGVVAAPHPHERIRQCLLENAAVAVAGGEGKYEAVVVTPGFECSRGAFAGHHPIVMGFLRIVRAKIVFGNMREDAQRFLL